MKTIVFIGGIRTHYIKINAIQKTLKKIDRKLCQEFKFLYIDAGQHYDIALNGFKDELNLHFDYTLRHRDTDTYKIACDILKQLGDTFDDIQKSTKIDYVVVMGDVTTTIIAVVAAVLKGIRVVHIESGARINREAGGEEYYRTAADHLSYICFASTMRDLSNLVYEGLGDHSYYIGDIVLDYMKSIPIREHSSFCFFQDGELKRYDCTDHEYILASLHHTENIAPEYLSLFFKTIKKANKSMVFIAHPRVLKILHMNKINTFDFIIADYIPYKENLNAIMNAKYIITDSGGMQREAYFYNKRCIVRSKTNVWINLVELGANYVTGSKAADLTRAIRWAETHCDCTYPYDNSMGDGNAVEKMLQILLKHK